MKLPHIETADLRSVISGIFRQDGISGREYMKLPYLEAAISEIESALLECCELKLLNLGSESEFFKLRYRNPEDDDYYDSINFVQTFEEFKNTADRYHFFDNKEKLLRKELTKLVARRGGTRDITTKRYNKIKILIRSSIL